MTLPENQQDASTAVLDLVHNSLDLCATSLAVVAMAGLILVGPLLLPALRFVAASGFRVSIYFAQRAWRVIADKIIELLVTVVLVLCTGIPALEFFANVVLRLFNQ